MGLLVIVLARFRNSLALMVGAPAAALAASAGVAVVLQALNGAAGESLERGVLGSGIALILAAVLPLFFYVARRRCEAVPGRSAQMFALGLLVALVGLYFYSAAVSISFPADVLIWSESDFVNDIIKLRIGYPIYTQQQNNESFHYTPGAQILTWAVTTLLGQGDSLPLYRAIQLGLTIAAAFLSVNCLHQLLLLAGVVRSTSPLSNALVVLFLILAATNARTNPFVHLLHNDALAQLVTVIAYWVLLKYAVSRRVRWLAAMVAIPALGFFVKQSLALWLGLYGTYLLFFDRPISLRRIFEFGIGASALLALMIGLCYARWGEPFLYWIAVPVSHDVSPLRAIQHALDVWPYLAAGLLGGVLLIGQWQDVRLLGVWVVWILLTAVAAYTSGIAWMLNHIGPGSLIASTWLAAGLAAAWPSLAGQAGPYRVVDWFRTAAGTGVAALALSGLGFVRVPMPPLPEDTHRYIREIEREFEGISAEDVLLDMGSWVYLKEGVVMKDRAPSFGDRGYGEVGDFSAMITRLRERRYAKLIVRNLHSDDFWYDHGLWRRSSGIRQAILDNYEEIRAIEPVDWQIGTRMPPYGFTRASVLVPKAR